MVRVKVVFENEIFVCIVLYLEKKREILYSIYLQRMRFGIENLERQNEAYLYLSFRDYIMHMVRCFIGVCEWDFYRVHVLLLYRNALSTYMYRILSINYRTVCGIIRVICREFVGKFRGLFVYNSLQSYILGNVAYCGIEASGMVITLLQSIFHRVIFFFSKMR